MPAKRKAPNPKSKLTAENIKELEKRFSDGATAREAIAGIMSEETYYKHLRENTEFAARMDVAREYITEIARSVVAKRIKRGDDASAKWWLERRDKKNFSTRQEMTGADGQAFEPVVIYRPEKLGDSE